MVEKSILKIHFDEIWDQVDDIFVEKNVILLMEEISASTSWGWQFIPLFTGF